MSCGYRFRAISPAPLGGIVVKPPLLRPIARRENRDRGRSHPAANAQRSWYELLM